MLTRNRSYRLAIVLPAIALSVYAWADPSGTVTLAPSSFLNLDNGAVSRSGGDIAWNGTALSPQGHAGLYNLGKYGSLIFKNIRASQASSAPYGSAPIASGTLVAGDIFGVRTNGGNYAKVIVTAVNGTSVTLQYTTFVNAASAARKASAAAAPVITQVQNNYSFILPGLPNYGIAPGSLFIIAGSGLSTAAPPVLQSSAAPGLPKTLNQTSVSVTVNGVTTTPALYYTSAGQLAAVLPSTTPVGTGTITVTYNGQTSAAAPIQVAASAIGLDTLYGTGNGAAVATDNNGNVFGFTGSATPGQTIILWGSGIGADPANDDRTYPQTQDNLTSIPLQVYIGGVAAKVLYAGRSQYPGLDQYNVVVPANVPLGCYVSVVMTTGLVASNTVTIPVSANGGACSDPATGLSGTQLQSLASKGTGNVNSLVVIVGQQTEPGGSTKSFGGLIAGALTGSDYGEGYEYASQGSCMVVPPEQGSFTSAFQSPLDAGMVQMSGPAGQLNLAEQVPGFYQSQLASATLATGTYTFTGSGGANVGSFKVAVNIQGPLTLTNAGALTTITRSQGATVTWSGGFPNGEVQVEGTVGNQDGSVRVYCYAPSSAGQLTIPSSIMSALPPGGGFLEVTNFTAPQTVSASGVDIGLAEGIVQTAFDATFK